MNELTAMEIINLMDRLEAQEGQRDLNDKDQIVDRIFYMTFGLDWNKTKYIKELRKNILSLMDLISVRGYYYLVTK